MATNHSSPRRCRATEEQLHRRSLLVHRSRCCKESLEVTGKTDPLVAPAWKADRRIQLRQQQVLSHRALSQRRGRGCPARPLCASLALRATGSNRDDRFWRRTQTRTHTDRQQYPLHSRLPGASARCASRPLWTKGVSAWSDECGEPL